MSSGLVRTPPPAVRPPAVTAAAPSAAALTAGVVLLPAAGPLSDWTPVTSRRADKRKRLNNTPEASAGRLIDKIAQGMKEAEGKIGTAALNLKCNNIKSLADSVGNFMNTVLVSCLQVQASNLSDIAGTITSLNEIITDLQEENNELRTELEEVKNLRESQQYKESCREMEVQVREAVAKVKVMDLDFGACLTDRKQLQDTARDRLKEKVRSDLRDRYDTLMARASLAVISRATTRRAYPEGEKWTAPILLTIPDKETRWETEDILRKSNVFPSFHWPKEMIEPVKVLRKAIVDSGIDEASHYIRIRPEDRDGRLRLRADTKPKAGSGKFTIRATWNIPALDNTIRNRNRDWAKPTMAVRTEKTGPQARLAQPLAPQQPMDFTSDFELNNL